MKNVGQKDIMRFELIAEIKFEAEDIDDAFLELAKHFIKLATGEDSDLFNTTQNGKGEIRIVPVKEVKDE